MAYGKILKVHTFSGTLRKRLGESYITPALFTAQKRIVVTKMRQLVTLHNHLRDAWFTHLVCQFPCLLTASLFPGRCAALHWGRLQWFVFARGNQILEIWGIKIPENRLVGSFRWESSHLPSSWAVARSFSMFLLIKIMFRPLFASCRAYCFPMPSVPPVTTASRGENIYKHHKERKPG